MDTWVVRRGPTPCFASLGGSVGLPTTPRRVARGTGVPASSRCRYRWRPMVTGARPSHHSPLEAFAPPAECEDEVLSVDASQKANQPRPALRLAGSPGYVWSGRCATPGRDQGPLTRQRIALHFDPPTEQEPAQWSARVRGNARTESGPRSDARQFLPDTLTIHDHDRFDAITDQPRPPRKHTRCNGPIDGTGETD